MFGLLNIHKPAGLTSRDVVNRVQKLARPAKVGHAGTLDPLATGVLVVCLGPATRLIEYVQQMPKHYRGTFLLGRESDTEDIEGQVVEVPNSPIPTLAEIEAVLPRFIGEIDQRPPAFSALKVAGQRAYDLARQGQQVELAPRKIMVHELILLTYEYPRLELDIHCGSGTYVRSLGRDLAISLGTRAVMSALIRTAIGDFRLQEACALDELTPDDWSQHVQSPRRAVALLRKIQATNAEVERLSNGLAIDNRFDDLAVTTPYNVGKEIAVENEAGNLVALVAQVENRLAPRKFFGKHDE